MHLLDTLFDKIFIINLDTRPEKWEKCLEQLVSNKIENYERFSAIKPQYTQIPKNYYNKLVFSQFINNSRYVTGAVGCKMSHHSVVKIAKERGYKKILILEDDFQLKDSFNQVLQDHEKLIKNLPWDMLYFGGNYMTNLHPVNKNLYRATSINTTHAYALNQTVFDLIIDNVLPSGAEIDYFYRKQIHMTYHTLCIYPSIITQRQGYSDILNINVNYKM